MFWGERGLLITRQHYITLYNIHLYTIYHHISCLRTNISIHIHPMSSGQSVSNASTSRRRAPAFVWAVCGSPFQCLSSAPSARPLKVSLIQFLQIMASLRFGCLAKPKKIYGRMSHLLIFGKPIDLPNQGLRNYNFWGLSPCQSARWQLDVQLASFPESPWRVDHRLLRCWIQCFHIFYNSCQFFTHLPSSAPHLPIAIYCNDIMWHTRLAMFSRLV